jgi:excisionase family DNA binding protein
MELLVRKGEGVTISTVDSNLLSKEDREKVEETLKRLENEGSLPQAVKEPMIYMLRVIARGGSAAILDTTKDLTSTQAAELVGVSRPFLNKLLDEGRIPFLFTGWDRRIAASDVVAYIRLREDLKVKRVEAAATYENRRNEKLASLSGISSEEAAELGFG